MKKLLKKLNNLDEHRINKFAFFLILSIFIFYFVFSFFRDATVDEALYLRETLIITETLRDGKWFGNYGTGLHGFLFKLPVALIFLVTGPSVFVATLFTILLSAISCWLFFKLLYNHLKVGYWALAGIFLLATNFEFFRSSLTFLREIPVLFAVLLFLHAIFLKKNRWLIGLSLLLILDAKEYVFFAFAPPFILWIIIEKYLLSNKITFNLIKNVTEKLIICFLPSIIFLVLMFCSGTIPLNMYNAAILGFVKHGQTWNSSQFTVSTATANLVKKEVKQIVQIPTKTTNISETSFNNSLSTSKSYQDLPMSLTNTTMSLDSFFKSFTTFINIINVIFTYFFSIMKNNIIIFINVILAYLGKILYPRTFSFISIPMIIIIPSFVTSLYLFKKCVKKKLTKLLILPLIMWVYFLIFILRASHGRYLFPIAPIIFIFFILFLKEYKKKLNIVTTILIITFIFIIGKFFFEATHLLIFNIIFNFIFFTCLICFFYIKKPKKWQNLIASITIVAIFGFSTLSTNIAFSYRQGQVKEYIKWGRNREIRKILSNFREDEKIWINTIQITKHLVYFYRKDLNYNPEWYWELQENIPKKYLIITPKEKNTYMFPIINLDQFRTEIQKNKIDKLVLIYSTIPDSKLPMQQNLKEFKKFPWLSILKTVKLKNKNMYIFKVL